MGASNFLEGVISEKKEGRYITTKLVENASVLSCRSQTDKIHTGMPVTVSFRPDACDLKLVSPDQADSNDVSGIVKAVIFLGDFFEYTLDVGGASIRARIESTEPISVGSRVWVIPDPEKCIIIPGAEA